MEVKNYKVMCELLGEKPKTGKSKQYQMIDWERHFTYEKKGNKFIITEVFEEAKHKVAGRNYLPFIEEMEVLLLDLMIRSDENIFIASDSKLMRKLCMVNPNYTKYFSDREKLSELTNVKSEYIMDFYDTTNSTFKGAIETVTKRLESRKLVIHEKIVMVEFIDTSVTKTPTGHVRIADVLDYNEETDSYKTKAVKPRKVFRPATDEELQHIIRIERDILVNEYNCSSIHELFKVGKIRQYYRDVNRRLFKGLNIKRSYKANKYTYDANELEKQKVRLLDGLELKITQDLLNQKVIKRVDENSSKRYKKSMDKLTSDGLNPKKGFRVQNDYVSEMNALSGYLIDTNNAKAIGNKEDEDEKILKSVELQA